MALATKKKAKKIKETVDVDIVDEPIRKNKKKKRSKASSSSSSRVESHVDEVFAQEEVIEATVVQKLGAFEGGIVNPAFSNVGVTNYPQSAEGGIFADMLSAQVVEGKVFVSDIHERVSFYAGGGGLLLL